MIKYFIFIFQALQGLADETEDYFEEEKVRGKQRKQSRFLRRGSRDEEPEQERSRYHSDLANSVSVNIFYSDLV